MLQLILVECCVQLKYQQWGFNRAQSCCKFQFLARMSILYVPSVCYLTKQRILSYCSRSKMYDSCLHILLQNRNKEISLWTRHASLTRLFPFPPFGNKKWKHYLFIRLFSELKSRMCCPVLKQTRQHQKQQQHSILLREVEWYSVIIKFYHYQIQFILSNS